MIEDSDIIQRYLSGNVDIIDLLIDRYKNPLYNFCYHLTANRNDADDLFQETWIRVVKNIGKCDMSKGFTPWLYAIALNHYRDRYRKSKRWLSRIKDYFTSEDKDQEMNRVKSSESIPEEKFLDMEQREQLRDCVNRLDDKFKLPIVLFYFREMSLQDIAEMLHIPLGTVKSRLSSGKKKLRELMEVAENGR